MIDWTDLGRELDLWQAAGRKATLWWRDDDVVADTPALQRLFATAKAPIALAVIPARAGSGLTRAITMRPRVTVLQHGYQHQNNASAGARKSEFPDSRPIEAVVEDLLNGQIKLSESFPDHFLPVLTPPWNRIGAKALATLEKLEFRGLSTYLARQAAKLWGVTIVNTHVDVIDWQGNRGFLGEAACLDLLIGHLNARRLGEADPDEPTGLLTHHLVHDADTWRFLENLQDFLRIRPGDHPAARFIEPAEAFGIQPGSR